MMTNYEKHKEWFDTHEMEFKFCGYKLAVNVHTEEPCFCHEKCTSCLFNLMPGANCEEIRANWLRAEALKGEPHKWRQVFGYCTPGGDPVYICSVCNSPESEHVYGVEHEHNFKDTCPVCGAKLKYF